MFCIHSLRGECQHSLKYRHLSQNDQALVGYFAEIVKQFKKLPTYKWLKEANIVPSTTQNYTLAAIQGALAKKHGGIPYIGCQGKKVRTRGFRGNASPLLAAHFDADS